jgi:uncharacterized damage-inducible protein DinB
MFSRDMLIELYRHMEWADAVVWKAVPKDNVTDERLRRWLLHIHVVQRAFLCVWTNQPLAEALRSSEDFPTLADIRAWAQPYYHRAMTFVTTVGEDQLGQPIDLPWVGEVAQYLGRPPAPTSLAITCFQVTSHSTYHRGQVNARLRELGVDPPLVDYIAWIWSGRPAPEWLA